MNDYIEVMNVIGFTPQLVYMIAHINLEKTSTIVLNRTYS